MHNQIVVWPYIHSQEHHKERASYKHDKNKKMIPNASHLCVDHEMGWGSAVMGRGVHVHRWKLIAHHDDGIPF